VVNLPFWHWKAVQTESHSAKADYLRNLIERAREEAVDEADVAALPF
jgi:hypothetical protein